MLIKALTKRIENFSIISATTVLLYLCGFWASLSAREFLLSVCGASAQWRASTHSFTTSIRQPFACFDTSQILRINRTSASHSQRMLFEKGKAISANTCYKLSSKLQQQLFVGHRFWNTTETKPSTLPAQLNLRGQIRWGLTKRATKNNNQTTCNCDM